MTEPSTSTLPADPAAPAATPAPPAPAARWRLWPSADAPNATLWRALVVASAIGFVAYLYATMRLRFELLPDPYACDGDQPQAVWHYWRYAMKGAFPAGDLLTDYAFVMHAPAGWWAMMAPLSAAMGPLAAAKALNVVAYVGTMVAIYLAVALRSNHFVGLAAAFLLARTLDFHGLIAGGYARSFGPLLVLWFLGAFMLRRHVHCLVVLVVQAALYPSVVIPCGLAYGLYTVVAGPTMKDRLRRMAGMLVAGLLVIAFGLYQDIQAPKWWGSVVTLEQAEEMPAWSRKNGRVPELPMHPATRELRKNFTRVVRISGAELAPPVGEFAVAHASELVFGLWAAGAIAYAAVWLRARRRGRRLEDPFPWQILLVAGGSLVAYFLARAVFFKLYLPYRALAHVIPYLMFVGGPLLLWSIFTNALVGARQRLALASGLTFVLATAPSFVVLGNGVQRVGTSYYTVRQLRGFYEFIQKLPLDVQLAGEIGLIDRVPLFTWHRAYVTKNLAHPFRPGYYAEAERRLRLTYKALYASDPADIVRISRAEKIDYWVYNADSFTKPDKRLFEPLKREMTQLFNRRKKLGFALQSPPGSAVVFAQGRTRVLSVDLLEAALEGGDTAPSKQPPAPALGPDRDDAPDESPRE